jgi:hypothetical protein
MIIWWSGDTDQKVYCAIKGDIYDICICGSADISNCQHGDTQNREVCNNSLAVELKRIQPHL